MDSLLAVLYILGLYSAYMAGFIYLRVHSAAFRLPKTTLLLLAAVAVPTTVQFFFPEALAIFERDYTRFVRGEWWRLITPLFFQDGGVSGAVFNLVSLALIGTIAEQLWDTQQILLIFFVGGVTGELVGFAWQPIGAGNSVANFSLAASIAVACLTRQPPRPAQLAALLALGADVVLAGLTDIHGAAALAGAALALLLSQWQYQKEQHPI